MQLQNQTNAFGEKLHLLRPSWGIPEVTLRSLGRSWIPLGASWEPLGRVLGASWGILRPLGEVLGPLGALLGPLGVVCWGYVAAASFLNDFWFDFGPILGSKRLPKWVQNGSQNGPKSSAKINMKLYGFWNPLGRVLGPSWVVLGSILGSKIIKFHLFLKGFVKIHIFDADEV